MSVIAPEVFVLVCNCCAVQLFAAGMISVCDSVLDPLLLVSQVTFIYKIKINKKI